MSTGMGMRFCSSSFGGRNIEAPATTSTTANPDVINASGNFSAGTITATSLNLSPLNSIIYYPAAGTSGNITPLLISNRSLQFSI